MRDTPSRVFGLMCLLVAVWIATYWLYEPAEPRVTFDTGPRKASGAEIPRQAPAPLAQLSPAPRGDMEDAPAPERPLGADEEQKPAPQPAPPPKPVEDPMKQARVVAPQFREYVVQNGDNGWEAIAQRVYGDRSLWKAVSQANPFVTPDRLIAGRTKLRIPVDPNNVQGVVIDNEPVKASPKQAAKPAAPEPGAAVEYVIKSSDTLSGISKAFYGKATMWQKIYNANRDVIDNPDSLREGTKIKIPPR